MQYKKAIIKWFLEFQYMDLSKTNDLGRSKILSQAIAISEGLGRWLFDDNFNKNSPRLVGWYKETSPQVQTWIENGSLEKCQLTIIGFLEKFMKNLEGAKNDWGRHEIKKKQNFYILDELSLDLRVRLETPIIEWEGVQEDKKSKKLVGYLDKEKIRNSPVKIVFNSSKVDKTLLFYLLRAIDGFSLKHFRICPECGRYFIHTTKRKREYCTRNCAMRKVNRDRRRIKKLKDFRQKIAEHSVYEIVDETTSENLSKPRDKDVKQIEFKDNSEYKNGDSN